MESIFNYLKLNHNLSYDAAQKLASIMREEEHQKGDIFVKNGIKNLEEYILVHGICRSYVMNPSGNEITLSFYTTNTAISPNLTRTESGKSILHIQALTDIRLIHFSTNDLLQMMHEHRDIETWANAVLQAELLKKVRKEINQNALTAKERLIDFRKIYPSLENLIPHTYISSYLGITNVSLSRIRKELSNS